MNNQKEIKRNHHYVSQVLSRKFFSDKKKIYVFNKSKGNIKDVLSSKKLFSKKDLNAVLTDLGEIDYNSIEELLDKNFETDFNKHFQNILNAVNSNLEVGKNYENVAELQFSIEYLTKTAIIGELRHPQKIKDNQNFIFSAFNEIAEMATDELKNKIFSMQSKLSVVENKIPINYKKVAEECFKNMGDVRYAIMKAPDNCFFILPDTSSLIRRFQMKSDIIDGVEYINPSMPIGLVIMPLNSKILLTAASRCILPEELKNQHSGFHKIDENIVNAYNKSLYDNSYSEIACENKEYLEKFLSSIKLENE